MNLIEALALVKCHVQGGNSCGHLKVNPITTTTSNDPAGLLNNFDAVTMILAMAVICGILCILSYVLIKMIWKWLNKPIDTLCDANTDSLISSNQLEEPHLPHVPSTGLPPPYALSLIVCDGPENHRNKSYPHAEELSLE